jgi:predicted amidohydrolase YtcJ
MQSMVTRAGVDDGVPVGASQRVTAREALNIFTLGSAQAEGTAHLKGRLAPGYLADFTVLGDDPLTVDPHAIASIPVKATVVGGECVHEAAGEG